VIEPSDEGYIAYAPDLPGSVALGIDIGDIEERVIDSIIEQINILLDAGRPLPEAVTEVRVIEVRG
jgi:predicted RNase H-like HicB family nuclease